MSNHDYDSIWQSLDSGVSSISSPGLLKRLIDPDMHPELHLAVSIPDKARHLLVRMPDDWREDIIDLPRWKGADIFVYRGEERPVRGKYLAIRQGRYSTREVFQSLIADLCDTIYSSERVSSLEGLISERLERWRVFFEEQGQEGLSPEAQQGLFGELLFIRDYLIPALGMRIAVKCWTGSKRMDRDFQFGRHAVEIKTSSGKQHQKVFISNEKQLDMKGLDFLDLVFFSLELMTEGGETLPAIVTAIRELLSEEVALASVFNDKLLDAGYLDVLARSYTRAYVPMTVKAYRVSDEFPRILGSNLPEGVGDITYSVMLSACESFRIPVSEIVDDVVSRMEERPKT